MNSAAENVAFLYLMNQDTKSLSLAELYQLYTDTVKQAEACAKKSKGSEFGFTINP